ncbi:MAG: transcription termination/antitermination factor NusG [Solobacterium sp.]|nr:transcription termination/antitermination factor NusG [Solobacterium sp.]
MTEKNHNEEERRWYVVNTYSGHENRVKDNLEKRVESMGIQDSLFRVLVAEEPVIDIKNGKQIETMKNIFPGYVFVEMRMTDEAWYVVRNTPGVTGFIGSSGGGAKPFPVSPDEMESILRRMGQSDKKVVVDFTVGDTVRILTGPFSGMEGRVNSMNDQSQVASVMTMLFGRETPTDINYSDLQKVTD